MYGRHFESMYTGSMYGQGFGLFAIWGYVISHEHGGIVELNPKLLSDLFGEPLESVSTLVNKLCNPDNDSRSKAQEGRRLVKIGQFAYQVVNAAEYAKIASEADRRSYLAKKQREHRKRQHSSTLVNKPSTSVKENIPSDTYTDTYAEANAKEIDNTGIFPSLQNFKDTGIMIGLTEQQAEQAFYYASGKGVKISNLADWLKYWKLNEVKFTRKESYGQKPAPKTRRSLAADADIKSRYGTEIQTNEVSAMPESKAADPV